jgi:hypothetical protein
MNLIQTVNNLKKMPVFDIYNNLVGMSVSGIIAYNIYLCNYVSKNNINNSLILLNIYFIIDFFICRIDIKIHHVLILLLMLFNYYYDVATSDSYIIILALYKTEYSTTFLSIENILKYNKKIQTYISPINKLLFFITFVKFRIYDLYNNVIINPDFYYQMDKYTTTTFSKLFLYTSIYGFYILNLYWVLIICKITIKSVINKINPHDLYVISEYITQYTLFLNIPIAGYIYLFTPKFTHTFNTLFNISGISILAVNSYIYHNKIYCYLVENKKINYLDNEIIIPYVNDNISIHINSLLYLLTNVLKTENPCMYVFYMSLSMHLFLFYIHFVYIIKLKNGENKMYYNNEKDTTPLFYRYLCTALPVSLDVIYSIHNTNDLTTKLNLFIVSIVVFLILKIKPFYELNHILFHIGLILQQVFLSYCIVNDHKYK